jgi:RNA polymerase sigma factor (TIGR02999 family)
MFSQTNPGARVKANRMPTGDPTADGYWAGDYSIQKGPPRRRPRCSEHNALRVIQATALVHEAYLRLVGDASDRRWDGRSHFFAAAAQAMRHVLVEAARRKARQKRGGGHRRVDLADPPAPDPDEELLALDDALNRLASEDPVAARVIELRQFAGLGHEETAAAMGITVYLARQKWTYARAWLGDVLGG